MKKGTFLKHVSAVMAGVMVMSMTALPVFAEEISSVDLKKTVTTDGHTFSPAATFSFQVATGEAGKVDNNTVYAGVEGGLVLTDGNDFNFTPAEDESVAASYEKAGTITVNKSVFTRPGVYHYQVWEIVPETDKYEGMDYDEVVRDVYVTIENGDNDTLEVTAVKVVKEGETTKADELAFTNIYGEENNNEDKVYDLLITKSVTGNQGDKNADFSFTVKVDGAEGERYQVIKTKQDGTTEESSVVSKADAATYTLKNGESLHLYGLTEGDTYTVNEEDYSEDGYTTTNGENTGNLTANGVEITVINDKNVGAATGLAMSVAPYVLMLCAAGAAGGMFLRRKKED